MIAVRNIAFISRVAFLRRRDMLGRVDHRHVEGGVVGNSDLRSGLRLSADRLHSEPVGEDAVMADLVHAGRRKLEALARGLPTWWPRSVKQRISLTVMMCFTRSESWPAM